MIIQAKMRFRENNQNNWCRDISSSPGIFLTMLFAISWITWILVSVSNFFMHICFDNLYLIKMVAKANK